MGDVIENHRAAHALDPALLEAVPGVVAGHEDHRRAALERRHAVMALFAPVDVGAELVVAGAVGEIDQAGEFLHAQVGVRLEPEAVDVLGVFEAKKGVVDRRGEGFGDQADDLRRLQRLRDRPHDGETHHRRRIEIENTARESSCSFINLTN